MTAKDYAELGLKAGLEIHQQLDTAKKLFCRCKAGEYNEHYDAEILRHMRPTLSELGEYDGTALMEFKTQKEIIYQLNKETVCTYEMDDAPPFELNEQALDIALEITMLLNCNIVGELHIARKQYLDGSIPTGFQRTTILGIDGEIPYKNRKIGIIQLGLEEDACREVKDIGHTRTYKTDRLGMPLIEIVTYPDMCTPQEMADVAQILRKLTRITGKVRRGIGAARQDVNVSIAGGTRIEIKGVSRIPLIPLLVHNEANRQQALLEIKAELQRRGINNRTFEANFFEVTELLRDTKYQPIQNAWRDEFKISCVRLKGYKGILRHPTQPETNFAKEISDRLRVVACLDQIPNIVHSDSDDETISSTNWTKIRRLTQAEAEDALVIVWGNPRDVNTAEKEIAIRASEAITGIPSETRQAWPDGTNGFERILPGPDRMYPDTDLPPIPLTAVRIKRIQAQLPELPWQREKRYTKMSLPQDVVTDLVTSPYASLFDKIVNELKVEPLFAGVILTREFKHLKRKGLPVHSLSSDDIYEMFTQFAQQKITSDGVRLILNEALQDNKSVKALVEKYYLMPEQQISKIIGEIVNDDPLPVIIDRDKKFRYLMGRVMNSVRGRADARAIVDKVKALI